MVHVFDSVFADLRVSDKHRRAPLFAEREKYLTYLTEIGVRRMRLQKVATMLLHVVRLLNLESPRPIGTDEISRGCNRWIEEPEARRYRRKGTASQLDLRRVATKWLRFQGSLIVVPPPAPPFAGILSAFLHEMLTERGLAVETLKSYQAQLSTFLKWLHPRCAEFSMLRASDVEEYIDAQQNRWGRRTLAAHCRTLRTFFGWAERKGWCSYGMRGIIRAPCIPRIAENLVGPPWEEVRRLIASIGSSNAADLRAKAMIMLFSIYGLRSAEVRGLLLEDIDWRTGSITVLRAKGGKTQQFPLQNEVGEAIALYLEKARPRCTCRFLFVTLRGPFRPVGGHTMSAITNPRMKRAGLRAGTYGPHMLRRACATQLLRTGTSLREIADFLGHSDLRSVSNYAKFDSASLMCVAQFSLRGVL